MNAVKTLSLSRKSPGLQKKPLSLAICSLLLFGCALDNQDADAPKPQAANMQSQLPSQSATKTETQPSLESRRSDEALMRPQVAAKIAVEGELKTQRQNTPQTSTAGAVGLAAPAQQALLMEKRAFIAPEPVNLPSAALQDRETYQHFNDNPVQRVAENPVSTFSIDVDTQSYANLRRLLNQGIWPRQDAVRVEEMLNYFDYHDQPPQDPRQPFSVTTEVAPSPWSGNYLLRVGIQGYQQPQQQLPPANLVFLIDVSGSMQEADKLPLVQQALRLLVNHMRAQDRIALVVYAGAEGLVLEPTPGDQKARILAHIDALSAGGSTNGGAGIKLAYQVARQAFIKGGINRVILASDGDFNVGTVNLQALEDRVARERESGVSLSTLAFGVGNTNFELMEQLADKGNGNAAYIDSLREANKVLVTQMSGTLMTIAKDVKIQLEFNPQWVQEYRLIGYENRMLKREDFNNDKVDAGEIGAGHSVTALYEVTLRGQPGALMEPLRYGESGATALPETATKELPAAAQTPQRTGELGFLKLRYKQPDGSRSSLISQPIQAAAIKPSLAAASPQLRFAAAVAAFGQLLRGGTYLRPGFGYADVVQLANQAKGEDSYGYRGEFVQLVNLAAALTPPKG